MIDPWDIIGWVLIAGAVLLFLIVPIVLIFRAYISQKLTDRKRKRAHAGKVKCEAVEDEEQCAALATRVTPNGYFCENHQWNHSRKQTLHGSVAYSHRLAYTIEESK